MKKFEEIINKAMPYTMKFANAKAVKALKDGFVIVMPLTLIGSIFLLLSNLPITGYSEFMAGIFGENWAMGFNQVSGSTYDMIALFAVFGIAYSFVKNEGFEGVPAGMLGLVSLFIISKSSILVNNEVVNAVIPKEYLGGKGIIAAILIGLMVGYVYSWFLAKDINKDARKRTRRGSKCFHSTNSWTCNINYFFWNICSFRCSL